LGKRLFVSEKPSVAASFASVLGIQIQKNHRLQGYAETNDTIVTWCFGHLVTMAFPDAYDIKYKEWKVEHLPIIPEKYKYVVLEDKGAAKQFEVISGLMCREDVDVIYACTDSGREGEYIFRLVYNQSRSTKPVKRVWISSQTDEAIKKGIDEAKDSSAYDSLGKAAYWRSKEDWLFGMNFSRIFTCKYSRSLSNELKESKSSVIAIGRVMTCVLGLVVDRELEIRDFVPTTHYGVTANFVSQGNNISYKGKWVADKEAAKKESEGSGEAAQYITKEEAQGLIDSLQGQEAVVGKVQIRLKNEQPPLLFNLAELQSEVTKKFKIPVDKTLEIAQSLYEKKLISYPRTDSRVISTDVLPELPKVLNGLFKNTAFKECISRIKEFGDFRISKTNKRYVDNSKVTDHYAIIPTNQTVELSSLNADMRKVYELIVKRFLAAFYPPAVFNTVKVETEIKGELFVSNAKTMKEPGWKEIYEVSARKGEEEITDSPINKLVKKEKCDVTGFDLEEKETKPPSRYTDGSLIITMEKAGKFIENEELREQIKTCGIGTSATRSGIIKKLCNIGYINIHNKTRIITPSQKGEKIVEIVRRSARELLNPSLTASWEKGLVMIEKMEITEQIFQQKLYSYITKTIDKVKRR
jgi:DNA topoisomerase-3